MRMRLSIVLLLLVYIKLAASFNCKDSNKPIADAFVNDDFCDCLDGSDEWQTSACSNSAVEFTCENNGHISKSVPTSRINDSICDCCDGSDEQGIGKSVLCINTCKEENIKYKLQLQEKQNLNLQGVEKCKEYIIKAVEERNILEISLRENENEILFLEKEIKDLENSINELSEDELSSEMSLEERLQIVQSIHSFKLDLLEMNELQQIIIKLATLLPLENATSILSNIISQYLVPEKENQDACDEENQYCTERISPPILLSISKEKAPSEMEIKLKKDLSNSMMKKADLEKTIKSSKEELQLNYGPNNVFWALRNKCFSLKQGQYTWEICPFGAASQIEVNGSRHNLGKMTKLSDNYSKMRFENGAGCWNGPSRSLEVTIECGNEDALFSVNEPSKCVYTAIFKSPIMCVI